MGGVGPGQLIAHLLVVAVLVLRLAAVLVAVLVLGLAAIAVAVVAGLGVVVALLQVWQPGKSVTFGGKAKAVRYVLACAQVSKPVACCAKHQLLR